VTRKRLGVPSSAGVGACLALLALGLLACVSPVAPQRPLSRDAAVALWDGWREQVADRRTLRCSARLAVDGEGTRLRAKQRMAVALPSRLRVEIQGFLGTTAGVLTVDQGEYAFLQGEPRVFESGPVDDALLARVVAVDLSPELVVEVLLGAPEQASDYAVSGGVYTAAGLREVRLEAGRAARFDSEGRLRAYQVATSDAAPGWQAGFEDYALVDGAPVAHRLTLAVGQGTRAVLILRDIELNPALSPDIFRLDGFGPEAGSAGVGVEGG